MRIKKINSFLPTKKIEKEAIRVEKFVQKEIKKVFLPSKKRRHIRDFFSQAKDGTITGAADNDPAGIITYTQVGAGSGFSLLWLMLLTLPLLTIIEEMSARVGVVTKKGLNKIIATNFGIKTALFIASIALICNIATIGADIAAGGQILEILTKINWIFWVILLTFFFALIILKENYPHFSRYLFLLTPLFLLYVGAGILTNPSWTQVLRNTLIPSGFSQPNYWLLAVGLVGTTISPYLLFWQTSEEIEEHKHIKDLKDESKGVFLGMLFAHFIFYFIIIAAGQTLAGKGIIESASQAALALRPIAGERAFLFFSLGILVSTLISVPVLAASAGYVLSEAEGWKEGISLPYKKAKSFYLVILFSLFFGLLISLVGFNPIKMLLYTQVLNGLLMPILLVMLLMVSSSEKIMGRYKNSFLTNFIGWLGVIIIIIVDLLMIKSFFG